MSECILCGIESTNIVGGKCDICRSGITLEEFDNVEKSNSDKQYLQEETKTIGIYEDEELPFKIVNLEQGTQQWRDWRYTGIGASDSAVILGENRFQSTSKLLYDKLNKIDVKPNAKMQEGTLLEPKARKAYQETTDTLVQPLCVQAKSHAWLIASLDGISYDYNKLVEIKCGESTYRKAADGIIPKYYYCQMQHQLMVTHLNEIDYFCYRPGERSILMTIQRDDLYIEKLFEAERMFYKTMLENQGQEEERNIVKDEKEVSASEKQKKRLLKLKCNFDDSISYFEAEALIENAVKTLPPAPAIEKALLSYGQDPKKYTRESADIFLDKKEIEEDVNEKKELISKLKNRGIKLDSDFTQFEVDDLKDIEEEANEKEKLISKLRNKGIVLDGDFTQFEIYDFEEYEENRKELKKMGLRYDHLEKLSVETFKKEIFLLGHCTYYFEDMQGHMDEMKEDGEISIKLKKNELKTIFPGYLEILRANDNYYNETSYEMGRKEHKDISSLIEKYYPDIFKYWK